MRTDAHLVLQTSRLQTFLNEYRGEKGRRYNFTSLGKPLGSYNVPDEKLSDFYKHYVELIERQDVMPFLTEKQGQFSPILIDLDFKFELSEIIERKYDETMLKKIIKEYFEVLQKYLDLDDESGQCYVFERPSPYKTDKNIKDGLHIMFPYITCGEDLKLVVRDHVIRSCRQLLASLRTQNTVSDIVDEAVVSKNNWFVYGSGKPGCQPYRLTKIYDQHLEHIPFEHNWRELIPLLSVRGTTAANVHFKEFMEDALEEDFQKYKDRIQGRSNRVTAPPRGDSARDICVNARQLTVNSQKKRVSKFDYCENLDFVRNIVKILKTERADDYFSWMQVGWSLHNIDDSLLEDWIDFSARSEKFENGACEKAWGAMRDEGLGIGSLVRWARIDNDDAYEKLRSQDVKTLIEMAITSGGAHHSVGKVMYGMYRYNFICLSRKFKSWIEFHGHRWHRTEDGYGLLTKISSSLYQEFSVIASDYARRISLAPEEEKETMERRRITATKIGTRLLDSNYKSNVMKEAYELFYIEGFEEKLDINNQLIGFENGIYDLERMEFRDGRPEDALTLSCGIDYYPYDPNDRHVKTVEKIVAQIHRDAHIRNYVYKLMSSFLSGQIKQQKFHIWTGSGCHAKGSEMLMWGGGTKNIEDINVGELMMGDDGTPRIVNKLWRGQEEMYRIMPVKGESFVVNSSHKLALKATNTISISRNIRDKVFIVSWQERSDDLDTMIERKYARFRIADYDDVEAARLAAEKLRGELHDDTSGKVVKRGDIFAMPVWWYLNNRCRIGNRFYMLYRCPAHYEEKPIDLDPWFVGYWLGDGTNHSSDISTSDSEVLSKMKSILAEYGLDIALRKGQRYDHRIFPMGEPTKKFDPRAGGNYCFRKLREIGLIDPGAKTSGKQLDYKHIPIVYKYNSRENRLKLLAGIIDSDGSYQKTMNQYEITLKNEELLDDVISLARSLGFAAYKKMVSKTCTNSANGPVTGTYFRTLVYGDALHDIPVEVPRKKACRQRTAKRSHLVTNFSVSSLGTDDYYGVMVDQNHRYLDSNYTANFNSNGKSYLVEMFTKAFGAYSAVLPISLLTQKRSASNAATPELSRTKGRRFCVLQEPEDDVRINVGLMKELTGGDTIISRDLFCPMVEFKPQFKMVLTCNRLPDIPSNDGGTWRRIRVVEFCSKFCDDPDPDNPNEYKVDLTLSNQLNDLGQALMSILIEYHKKYKAEGLKEPGAVMAYTTEYQKRCDVYLEFVNTYVVNTGDRHDVLRLSEAYAAFKEFYRSNYGDMSRFPTSKDLKDYVNQRICKESQNIWKGLRLRAVGEENLSEDEEDD